MGFSTLSGMKHVSERIYGQPWRSAVTFCGVFKYLPEMAFIVPPRALAGVVRPGKKVGWNRREEDVKAQVDEGGRWGNRAEGIGRP